LWGFSLPKEGNGRKERKKMKDGMRWGLVVIVVAGLLLALYHFGFPFWTPYFFGGWGYRSFGPRMWPAFPLIGVLVIIILGFFLIRLFSSNSRRPSVPPDGRWTFCPHCGVDLRQGVMAEGTKRDSKE
jgi:hypothetical protein